MRERIRRECIVPLELDNSRVYDMDSEGTYKRRRPEKGQALVDAQLLAAAPRPVSPESETSPGPLVKVDALHESPS